MSINGAVIYFVALSFVGYIYETIAMSLWGGKFENRGFLYGPVIPIYGIGALLGTLFFMYVMVDAKIWQVFLIGVFASALLEYPTHYILEKVFHQRWWDYTKAPLNINGRICLPAALGFGLGGVIIVFVINPFLIPLINSLNPNLANILALLFIGVFAADFAITIAIISDFEDRLAAMGDKLDDHIEDILSNVLDEDNPLSEKVYDVFDKMGNAPKKAKEKISKVPAKAKSGAKIVKTRTAKMYRNTVRRYAKYKEYRKNAYAPRTNNER